MCKVVGSLRICKSRERLPSTIVVRRQPISWKQDVKAGARNAPEKIRSRRRQHKVVDERDALFSLIDSIRSVYGTLVSLSVGIWHFDELASRGNVPVFLFLFLLVTYFSLLPIFFPEVSIHLCFFASNNDVSLDSSVEFIFARAHSCNSTGQSLLKTMKRQLLFLILSYH